MKRYLLVLTTVIMYLKLAGSALAFCPEQPNDDGVCDTVYALCHDAVKGGLPPWEVHFSLLVTNDVLNPAVDSITAFQFPLGFSHTNPTAYCSLIHQKNTTSFTETANSIFRHFGGMQNRMMYMHEQIAEGEWDCINLWIPDSDPLFALTLGRCQGSGGTEDPAWWEGSKTLLATFTFLIEDTMTICLDTAFIPPIENMCFVRADVATYIPRDNMPYCVRIWRPERGDSNGDQVIDVSDVLYMINYYFRHGQPPVSFEAGDANCDNDHGILDVALLINYLYKGGPAPGCP